MLRASETGVQNISYCIHPLSLGVQNCHTIKLLGNPRAKSEFEAVGGSNSRAPLLKQSGTRSATSQMLGAVFSESRAPHHPAADSLLPLCTATKQLKDPDPSFLGYSRVLGKSCLGSPQIPPAIYNRFVSVSTRHFLPGSSQPEVHLSSRVWGPPKLRSPGFCPYSLEEKQGNCVPDVYSPPHLSSESPLSSGPVALSLGPRPNPPASLPAAPGSGPAAAPAAAVRPL